MSNKHLISIVTPIYNSESTIKETFLSVKNQSYTNWEWIVVDDGSSDGSYKLVESLKKDEPRIILLKTEKNSGAAAARNVGIKAANGRFIAFLDSDDLWKPNKLEEQVNFMLKGNYPLSFTDYDVLYPNGKVKEYKSKKDVLTYKDILKSNSIGCLTAMLDTSLVGKVYMPLDAEKREDHAFWLDISKLGHKAYRLNKNLAIYKISSGSVSSNKFKLLKYQWRVYRKHEKMGFFKSLHYFSVCIFTKTFSKY